MTRHELTLEQIEFLDKSLKLLNSMERKKIHAVHFEGGVKECSKE